MTLLPPFNADSLAGWPGADAYRAEMTAIAACVNDKSLTPEDGWSRFRDYALAHVTSGELPPFFGTPDVAHPTPWFTDGPIDTHGLWVQDILGTVVRPDYTVATRFVNTLSGEEQVFRGEQTQATFSADLQNEHHEALRKRGWHKDVVKPHFTRLVRTGLDPRAAWETMMKHGPEKTRVILEGREGVAAAQKSPPVQLSPITTAAGHVIDKGSEWLKDRARTTAKAAMQGHPEALAVLAQERQKAQAGGWLAQQFLTYVQSFLNQWHGNVKLATWHGEVGSKDAVVGPLDPIKDECLAVIKRARAGDQNAQAILHSLPEAAERGSVRARIALAYAKEVLEGGEAKMGAEMAKRAMRKTIDTMRKSIDKKIRGRHPALARLGHPKIIKEILYKTPGQKHVAAYKDHQAQGGGSSGGSNSGASDDSTLNPVTGQLQSTTAAQLVNASRAGDKAAHEQVRSILSDPSQETMAHAIRQYIEAHPEFAGERIEGKAVQLSHGHPLTPSRIMDLAATFGSEAETFLHYVQSPYGPPLEYRPAQLGQIVGRAQAYQAIRYPGAPLRIISERVAREIG
jgi:hypothetical protein